MVAVLSSSLYIYSPLVVGRRFSNSTTSPMRNVRGNPIEVSYTQNDLTIMQMKNYLIETFNYNDATNKKLLDKITLLNDKSESVKLFSHLINCQYKWMARIMKDPNAKFMSQREPIYDFDKLYEEWTKSLDLWISYISSKTDRKLSTETTFIGFDDCTWAATPKDIALQLNYHSIHHRAQIQTIIRQQGIEPEFVDYIGTKYRKLS